LQEVVSELAREDFVKIKSILLSTVKVDFREKNSLLRNLKKKS